MSFAPALVLRENDRVRLCELARLPSVPSGLAKRHRHREFLAFLKKVAAAHPGASHLPGPRTPTSSSPKPGRQRTNAAPWQRARTCRPSRAQRWRAKVRCARPPRSPTRPNWSACPCACPSVPRPARSSPRAAPCPAVSRSSPASRAERRQRRLSLSRSGADGARAGPRAGGGRCRGRPCRRRPGWGCRTGWSPWPPRGRW